jgi:hypothetical protein
MVTSGAGGATSETGFGMNAAGWGIKRVKLGREINGSRQ